MTGLSDLGRHEQMIDAPSRKSPQPCQPIKDRAHDLFSATRSQSAQRHPKHRAHYRSRKTSLATKRRAAWTVLRNRCRNIIADYDAETAVERELVLRLASLLWRIRRATSIETNLLGAQAKILRDRGRLIGQARDPVYGILGADVPGPCERTDEAGPSDRDPKSADLDPRDHPFRPATTLDPARDLSVCFQRLASFDSAAFERLGRYESALARQIVQVRRR
jgi:hypothetical protein